MKKILILMVFCLVPFELLAWTEVMPNVPQMGRFFSAVGAALQIATQGQANAQAALQEAEANMQHP
jgi:maltose-binding protein MalE